MTTPDRFRPGEDALYFLPLGGSGEIGMNLTLYGHAGTWLMVDLGISFADETLPGADVIMPDPGFILDRREDLAGLLITHAHEDHLGAVQYLWPDLLCPVYCTPFTASVLRAKLQERGLANRVPIIEIPPGGSVTIGPFAVDLIAMTHSVPEPSAVVIRTPLGTVLHTGDWKLDPDPVIGAPVDETIFDRLGDAGVLAMLCDSTNALVPGSSGSEASVQASLTALFGGYANRIAISCFATNVARVESIARAAKANGRHVALIGRSLWRIHDAARANGYLAGIEPFLTEHDAGYLPRDRIVLVCTGSQGEPRSALARIAANDHPHIVLEAGDVAIFSSREIPGNENAIGRVQNLLAGRGILVVTADDALVHVSGHPARDELTRLYQRVRPRIALPIHGEDRHLGAHARLAEECQVPQTLIPHNGDLIRLAPGPALRVDTVFHGRLVLDGKRLVPAGSSAIRTRQRLMHNGAAVATLVMTRDGELIVQPQVTIMGLLDTETDAEILTDLTCVVRDAVEALPRAARRDDAQVRQAAMVAVRRSFGARQGRKPVTDVHLVRV